MHRKRSRIFYRYLFSYAFAFLLPLAATSIFVSSYFLQIYQDEIVSNTLGRLNQSMTSLDFQLNRIRRISENVFNNLQFLPFYFPDNIPSGISAIQELKKYALEDDAVSEVIFYDGEGDFLFSSDTSYTVRDFISFHGYAWDPDRFPEEMAEANLPAVYLDPDAEGRCLSAHSGRSITFLYPDLSPYLDRRVMVRVNVDALYRMQQDIGANLQAVTFLLDANGDEVLRFRTDTWQEEPDFDLDLSALENRQMVRLNGRRYLYLRVRSAQTGWSYAALIDSENALAPVKTLRLIILAGTALLLAVGFGITYLFASRSYAPLRDLRGKLAPSETAAGNEYDDIQDAVEAIKNANASLSSQLQSASDAVREYLVYHLLKGSFPSLEVFNEKGAVCGLCLPRDRFQVASFYSARWRSLSPEEVPQTALRLLSGLPENVQALWRDCTESCAVVFALCAPEEADPAVRNFLRSSLTRARELLGGPVTVGISGCSGIADLPQLYLQATTATDYRLIRGADNLIDYTTLAVKDSIPDASFRHIREKLDALIRKGESEQIRNFLGNIVRYLQSSNPSIFQAKSICYDIVNAVNKSVGEICAEYDLVPAASPSVFQISSFETVDELVPIVQRISESLRELLQNRDAARPEDPAARMTGYIREHYAEADFSLQAMAEAFGMSAPNLSTAFKKYTGTTILDYATRLKITKAKELLTGSNMTLQDIALEVGYYNPTSFIRRFKQLTGMTPGEYKSSAHAPGFEK